jgi:Family of unknown function (DUF5683)
VRRWLAALSVSALAAGALGAPAAAQEPPPPPPPPVVDSLPADSLDDSISPRSAFLRSLVVPGWGQASVGSYGRGAVFFALQGASHYMLARTLARLGQARRVEDRVVGLVTDSINQFIAEATKPETCELFPGPCAEAERLRDDPTGAAFETEVAADTAVSRIRNLVDAREDQKQDWITYTIFFTMMGGVDAYVNRHLQDFPVDVLTTARPNGRYTVGLRVRVGGR